MSGPIPSRVGKGSIVTAVITAVAAGEILALVGGSACGKTALLGFAAGLGRPGEGRVPPNGQPSADLGIISREPRLFPWLDVAENLAFGLSHLSAFEREGLVANALVRAGLAGCEGRRPRELSEGQRQRVVMARALIARPKLLLLDEPFSALDAATRESLHGLLLALREESRPRIVIATRDAGEVVTLADRILFVQPESGRIVGGLDNLLPRPRDRLSPGFGTLEREVRRRLKPKPHERAPHRQVAAEVVGT